MGHATMKKWKDCTERADKWAWHAEVYAHRRVHLGVPLDEKTSPADPAGEWFNEELIRAAAEKLQAKRRQKRELIFTENELTDRAEFAQLKGYPNWPSFLEAVHDGSERIAHFVTWAEGRRSVTSPPTAGTFTKAGDALRHSVTKQEVAA
jgi:hypothetical protein